MTVIALATADRVRVVESIQQLTLVAAEAIVAGNAVRIDTTTGKFTKANGSGAGEARIYGIATKTVPAGMPCTAIRRGILGGWVLDALAYDASIFLSDTDGAIDTAAGTVSTLLGRVVPLQQTPLGVNPNKGFSVEL